MGGPGVLRIQGGCLVARPKSPLGHPYYRGSHRQGLPRVTVVLGLSGTRTHRELGDR
jgi:hypothetical protein